MGLILSLDIGSTNIKGVVFDTAGCEVTSSTTKLRPVKCVGGYVERDLDLVWECTKAVIRECVKDREVAHGLAGISLCGAGDGLVLLGDRKNPIGFGISSMDTRAADIVASWKAQGVLEKLYPLIGETPYPGTAVALLAWTKNNQPELYSKAVHICFLKDWVRYKLTDVLCTDPTDASATLTDLSGTYHDSVFELLGIEECAEKTVPIVDSANMVGEVREDVAREVGLPANLPVVCGVHDCSASALGTGCMTEGDTCVIFGSWSGNQAVAGKPVLDANTVKRWDLRRYVLKDAWLMINASPASCANLDWFLERFGSSIMGRINDDLYRICDHLVSNSSIDENILYHPFLYGAKNEPQASAGFYGLRPWHGIGDMLRALYEGIVFNHCTHVEELGAGVTIHKVRACGGGSRSDVWMQILADAVGLPVEVFTINEVSALGAAIVGAVGLGLYPDYAAAIRGMVKKRKEFTPDSSNRERLVHKKVLFGRLYDQLKPVWRQVFEEKPP